MTSAKGHYPKLGSLLLIFVGIINLVSAITYCNSTAGNCPEDLPCCSQYGECGTGAYCLGGCNIRFSYNISACMPQPRMSSFDTVFQSTDQVLSQDEYLGNASETEWTYTGNIAEHDNALLVQMRNNSGGTVISSSKYLWYGRVGANLKTSHDRGVITAFILFSDVQDEIDFESVGYNLTNPQTNYYALGILNYTNARNTSVSNTFENYHYYEIDWNEDRVDWYIDGEKVRTLEKADTYNETTDEYDYPQTPSRIQFSLWPGGAAGNGLGTIEWAGGAINWDSEDIQKYGYYYAYLQNITVKSYDLPEGVALMGNSSNSNDYHAFLYNSTHGRQKNVVLTNKETIIGGNEAVGWDPMVDDNSSSSSSSGSGSSSGSSKTNLKLSTNTGLNIPTLVTNGAATTKAGATSTHAYKSENGVGGFIQNAKLTSSSLAGEGAIAYGSFNEILGGLSAALIGLLSMIM